VFAESSPYPIPVPTRLTQRNRRTKTQPPRSPADKKGAGAVRVARGCAECGTPTVGRRTLCDECLTVAKARSAAKARQRSRLSRERRKAACTQQPTWTAAVNSSRAKKMRREKARRDAWEAAHAGEVWDQAASSRSGGPGRRADIGVDEGDGPVAGGVHVVPDGSGGLPSPASGVVGRVGRFPLPSQLEANG
jgi:hypothetical protein